MQSETGKAQETEENKTDVRTNGGNCQEEKPKQRKTKNKKIQKEINKGFQRVARDKKLYQDNENGKRHEKIKVFQKIL